MNVVSSRLCKELVLAIEVTAIAGEANRTTSTSAKPAGVAAGVVAGALTAVVMGWGTALKGEKSGNYLHNLE